MGEICHEVTKLLYCRSEQWMAPCAMLSAHSILLEFSIILDLNHSLQQDEEQDVITAQLLQSRTPHEPSSHLHVKKAANYIATA